MPKTTIKDKGHEIYPYLSKGLDITRSNQVWEADITYIPMKKGFMYLVAIIGVYILFVLGGSIPNSMEAEWCKSVVIEAINQYGTPEIFNTDQGSQFTSNIFTKMLLDNNVKISMDGKGRATDNIFVERIWKSVKQEKIYINAYENGIDLYKGLQKYFYDSNYLRIHQSLDYSKPVE